jgi:pimeloyl-ACP methyl ester carboxylesterase
MTTITEHEKQQVEQANATGRQPVVLVHGLWLLPSSWDRWAAVFEEAGYTALTPGWPDDPDTVAEANAHPEVMAHKTVGQVADHFDEIIRGLSKKPAVIGHSFGGLLTQILAGRGLAAAAVAIDPAPFRGVLPLPISALKSAWPVLHNLGRKGQHGPLGDRERVVQAAAGQQRRDRDRRDPQPRTRADDRQRLAGGRRQGARVRQALRLSLQDFRVDIHFPANAARITSTTPQKNSTPSSSARAWRSLPAARAMTPARTSPR